MNGFWGGKYECCFIDVRVFNPHVQSNRANELKVMYAKHEKEKRIRLYERRILGNELASFTHLVFSVTRGMANECGLFYRRLASMISSKRNQPYSQTLNWIQCSISFILLHSSIQCIRGARSSFHHTAHQPIDLVTAESDLNRLSVEFIIIYFFFYCFALFSLVLFIRINWFIINNNS